MYVKSKNRIISPNDLVKVRIVTISECEDENYDDENDIEIYPELSFSHGYTNEMNSEIPDVIKNNLDKLVDKYSTINIKIEEVDLESFRNDLIKAGDYLQISVVDVMSFDFKWNLSEDEKISICEILKSRGNYKAKLNHWADAFKNYHLAVKYLRDAVCVIDESHAKHVVARHLLVCCLNNAAAACLKLGSGYALCNKYCDHVLRLDPNNTKALYRRAAALIELNQCDAAAESIDKCLHLETDETAIKEINNIKLKCFNRSRVEEQRDKLLYRDMFDKMGEIARKAPPDKKSSIPYDIEGWDNSMADEMLSINEELEAFGEEMPPRISRHSAGGRLNGDRRSPIIEEDDSE